MKKQSMTVAALFVSVLAITPYPLMAQTADVGTTKPYQELAKENAVLRRQIAGLRDRIRQLESNKAIMVSPAKTGAIGEPVPKLSTDARTNTFAAVNSAATHTYAADISPVYKSMPAIVTEGGYYLWTDGLYERVPLPAYNVGLHHWVTAPDLGSIQSFDPRFDSGGVRGAFGYFVPGWGLRLELGGSYVAGSESRSQNVIDTTTVLATNLLNGKLLFGPNCGSPAFSCTVNGTLNTKYNAWQLSGKAAYDLKYGSLVLSPSVSLFGGTSRADQALTQAAAQFGIVNSIGTYAANTSLRWTDIGGRFGLDARVPMTSMFTVEVGGWVGVAGRDVSLSGSDTAISSFGGAFNGASSITASDKTAVFLANLEAGFAYNPAPSVLVRGFAGLNYDDKVPGIQSASFGNAITPIPFPAGIYYAHETNYYAGAGFNVRFGGPGTY